MSKPLVSDELGTTIATLLPGEPSEPKGGRPRRRPDKLHTYKAYDARAARLAEIHLVFLHLGCAFICLDYWTHRFKKAL